MILAAIAACSNNSKGTNGDAGGTGDGATGNDGANGGTTVTVAFDNLPTTPATYNFIAAYQDGTSAWQLAPAPTNGTYSFTIKGGTWGFAWMCSVTGTVANNQVTDSGVFLAGFETAERASLKASVPAQCTEHPAPTTYTITGTISNLPAAGAGPVTYTAVFGEITAPVKVTATTGTFTLTVPTATRDLLVVQKTGAGPIAAGVSTMAYVNRNLAITADQALAVDWSGALATQSDAGTAGDKAIVTTLFTGDGTAIELADSPTAVVGLAASQAAAGDVYGQVVDWDAKGTDVSEIWGTALASVTFTAPTAEGAITATEAATTPYPIVMTTWPAYANAAGYTWVGTQGGQGAGATAWTAYLSAAYVGTAPSFQMPDLSALTGWLPAFQLAGAKAVDITLLSLVTTGGVDDIPFANPAAGGTVRTRVPGATTVMLQ